AKEGEGVTLTCTANTSDTTTTYTWYREGHSQPMISGQTLQRYATVSETGGYYCTASNSFQQGTSTVFHLNILSPPNRIGIDVYPRGDIKGGSDVSLTCNSNGNPKPSYKWFQSKGKGWADKGTGNVLTLSQVTSEDQGEYYCQAQHELGEINSPMIPINIISDPPKNVKIEITPRGDIREGSDVTLTCNSSGNPRPSYKWFVYKNQRWADKGTGDRLVLRMVTSENHEDYYCQVQNSLGIVNTPPVRINVFYPPKHPKAEVNPKGDTKEGDDVTLTCSSHGNPEVSYSWCKGDHCDKEASTKILILKNVTSEDTGGYYCTAQNSLGTVKTTAIHINVTCKYSCSVQYYSIWDSAEQDFTSPVNLTCTANSNPRVSSYMWYKNGLLLKTGRHGNLRFTHITANDKGGYKCIPENSVGFGPPSREVELDVLYAPRNTFIIFNDSNAIISDIMLREGDNVTLTCETDSNPPAQITWYKNGIQYDGSSERTLQFYNMTIQDDGNYSCVATN
uniref:Ig-like domain-containing protein n=1 Tax=Latimeria chalumnae TaxID=7897 RepID=H3A807_LATCH